MKSFSVETWVRADFAAHFRGWRRYHNDLAYREGCFITGAALIRDYYGPESAEFKKIGQALKRFWTWSEYLRPRPPNGAGTCSF